MRCAGAAGATGAAGAASAALVREVQHLAAQIELTIRNSEPRGHRPAARRGGGAAGSRGQGSAVEARAGRPVTEGESRAPRMGGG